MKKCWFISRQKRRLTMILPALIAFNDVCAGKKWSGNHELQQLFEDELAKRDITQHGSLRARRTGQGGGGIRTLFKQMKDLGLVFIEEDSKLCRLTLIGDEIVSGKVSFVTGMTMQLKKYQYPSATCWKGSSEVDHSFKIHPFQFMMRLLVDPRLDNCIAMNEMSGIIIHYARSDSETCYEKVVKTILEYRQHGSHSDYVEDDSNKTYNNIANTFFNYLSLTQLTDRGENTIKLRNGKEKEAHDFIDEKPKFIPNPEYEENYIRAFGRGNHAKDMRDFAKGKHISVAGKNEARISQEFVLLALRTPIVKITQDIVDQITDRTGIDAKEVEKVLVKNHSEGNLDDFFAAYKELAHMGTAGATDFEVATCEMFKKIFHMDTMHVGQIGNTPDVVIKSDDEKYCGIIDNKAYKNGYSIVGDHKRRMTDEYIPNYKTYGKTNYRLAFFAYIAESFSSSIDDQLKSIVDCTGVNGSAMPVDILIDFAQDYAKKGMTHKDIEKIFSVDRQVRLSDIS